MKVCKFEKIKNEEEIIRIIDCIRNEHPHVVVIPTASTEMATKNFCQLVSP